MYRDRTAREVCAGGPEDEAMSEHRVRAYAARAHRVVTAAAPMARKAARRFAPDWLTADQGASGALALDFGHGTQSSGGRNGADARNANITPHHNRVEQAFNDGAASSHKRESNLPVPIITAA